MSGEGTLLDERILCGLFKRCLPKLCLVALSHGETTEHRSRVTFRQ